MVHVHLGEALASIAISRRGPQGPVVFQGTAEFKAWTSKTNERW